MGGNCFPAGNVLPALDFAFILGMVSIWLGYLTDLITNWALLTKAVEESTSGRSVKKDRRPSVEFRYLTSSKGKSSEKEEKAQEEEVGYCCL